MVIDGRALASDLLTRVRESLIRPLVVRAVVMEPSPATLSYLAIKSERAQEAGMALEVVRVAPGAHEEDIIALVEAEGADAVIVQLPLPASIDTARVVNAIPLSLDADVLSDEMYASFERGDVGALLPPVVGAVEEIFRVAHVAPSGAHAVVVGEGKLVGRPVASWLRSQQANVEVVSRTRGDLSLLKRADIVVLGAGQAGLVHKDLLKEGVVLIDAGTSESNGALAGDAHPSCKEVASVFTPVPGGVGPLAVACLFKNAAVLAAARA